MKYIFIAGLLVACAFPTFAPVQAADQLTKSAKQVVARSESRINQERDLALLVAPIKSEADLRSYLAMTPSKKSPLRHLSKNSQKAFLDSITFNEKGITGYNYSILERELSPTTLFQVLALFGSQHNTTDITNTNKSSPTDKKVISSVVIADDDIGGPCQSSEIVCDISTPDEPYDPYGHGGPGGTPTPTPAPRQPTDGTKKDYHNYQCFSSSTCSPRDNFICKSSC